MPLTYFLAGAPPCRPAQPVPQPNHTPPQRHIYHPSRQASKPNQGTPETHAAQPTPQIPTPAAVRLSGVVMQPSPTVLLVHPAHFALFTSPRDILAKTSLSLRIDEKIQKVVSIYTIFMHWRWRNKKSRAYKRIWNQRVKNRRLVCDASCTH